MNLFIPIVKRIINLRGKVVLDLTGNLIEMRVGVVLRRDIEIIPKEDIKGNHRAVRVNLPRLAMIIKVRRKGTERTEKEKAVYHLIVAMTRLGAITGVEGIGKMEVTVEINRRFLQVRSSPSTVSTLGGLWINLRIYQRSLVGQIEKNLKILLFNAA